MMSAHSLAIGTTVRTAGDGHRRINPKMVLPLNDALGALGDTAGGASTPPQAD